MTIFDADIRVELNSHGGVVLHFKDFVIWLTGSEEWRFTKPPEGAASEGFSDIVSCYEAATGIVGDE